MHALGHSRDCGCTKIHLWYRMLFTISSSVRRPYVRFSLIYLLDILHTGLSLYRDPLPLGDCEGREGIPYSRGYLKPSYGIFFRLYKFLRVVIVGNVFLVCVSYGLMFYYPVFLSEEVSLPRNSMIYHPDCQLLAGLKHLVPECVI